MTTTPQNVTNRYISNLLHDGQNADFYIDQITRHVNMVEGQIVGYFYKVAVGSSSTQGTLTGLAALPSVAIRRALESFGVTFK